MTNSTLAHFESLHNINYSEQCLRNRKFRFNSYSIFGPLLSVERSV